MPQVVSAALTGSLILNEKFTKLTFEYVEPPSMDFVAGQYTSIKINDQGLRRCYSIFSSPENNHGLEILIDVTPQGPGVQFLTNLKLGERVEMLMPMGALTIDQNSDEQAIVLVATGSGIAPCRSMLLDQLQNKSDQRPIYLYWGLRHESELFEMDDWEALALNFKNFHFHPVLSRALDAWTLCRGHVTDCLNVHELPAGAGFYLCGSSQMTTDVVSLLTSKGVKSDSIHLEKFY